MYIVQLVRLRRRQMRLGDAWVPDTAGPGKGGGCGCAKTVERFGCKPIVSLVDGDKQETHRFITIFDPPVGLRVSDPRYASHRHRWDGG